MGLLQFYGVEQCHGLGEVGWKFGSIGAKGLWVLKTSEGVQLLGSVVLGFLLKLGFVEGVLEAVKEEPGKVS